MSKQAEIEIIHESMVNGQRKQATRQIDEYGLYAFWSDYFDFLTATHANPVDWLVFFKDAVISYHRIKAR